MDSSKGSAEASSSINHDISQLSESQTQHCIYKVHKHLRDINNKAYDPQIIAIGPYHHGKDNLQMMEKHKLRYLKELLRREEQNVEQYTSVMGKLEKRARDCYGEPISLDQTEFIKMLVLDGCFIIELLKRYHLYGSYRENDPIFRTQWILNPLRRDLILFENQIPFFVLCELFNLIQGPNQHNILIYLSLIFFKFIYPGEGAGEVPQNWTDIEDCGEIKHLLHLIHTDWRPSFDTRNNNVSPDLPSTASCLDKTEHFLHLTRTAWRSSFGTRNNNDGESEFIHSATQLMDANVTFSKRESGSLFNVDYEKGTMVIPRLTVDDDTECLFRNLIAYEQYFQDSRMSFVADYVNLLDCLITSSRDVEILSECGIIDNKLGENEVVARIFNRLLDSTIVSEGESRYSRMLMRVNEHYRRPWNRAMAKLRRDYFHSPWAYLTFFSAVVLLLLTVAQTVLSALQLN